MSCNECEKNSVGKGQIGIIILGFYLLGAATYGTIDLIKKLISLF